MRAGLFAKILLAFWSALVGWGVALGLLYGSTSADVRAARRMAPALLTVVGHTVEREGVEAGQAQAAVIEQALGDPILIVPGSPPPPREGTVVQQVMASDGNKATLIYDISTPRPRRLPMVPIWAGLAAGLVASIVLARYLSRPLLLLRDGFNRLAAGDLGARLGVLAGHRHDEIGDLARSFDRMAERLSQLVGARDRLLRDVSHELRSPLSRLQLAIALARQNPQRTEWSLDRIGMEARKLEALVDELLTLARAESDSLQDAEFFDPVAALAPTLEAVMLEADARPCHIVLAPPPGDEDDRPVIAGSADLFQRAAENVLRNAVRFSPAGGTIAVAIDLADTPPRYRITVTDEGPGMDEALLDRVLEPFVKGGSDGIGLGLAIAARIVRSHGGTIACRNRPQGGLAVTIELPATLLAGQQPLAGNEVRGVMTLQRIRREV